MIVIGVSGPCLVLYELQPSMDLSFKFFEIANFIFQQNSAERPPPEKQAPPTRRDTKSNHLASKEKSDANSSKKSPRNEPAKDKKAKGIYAFGLSNKTILHKYGSLEARNIFATLSYMASERILFSSFASFFSPSFPSLW